MTDIILHHYGLSPFAEKVRIGLGLKQAAWKSVDIPNVMPKPDLMPLTGGYRKTPVMQIGADIYCDTQLIMLELDRRLPSPALLPEGREGEARAITMWADRLIFSPAVGVVMSQVADKFGEAFKKDRSEFSGRSFDPERMRAALPFVRDQTYALLSLAEAMLADGRRFLLGGEPSLADCALYNPVWFIRQHLGSAAAPLDRHPKIAAWAERMSVLGHGKRADIKAGDALEIAKAATPGKTSVDGSDPSGLKAGQKLSVTPDDTGKVPVTGTLVGLTADRISLARHDERVGDVVVHFPRAGFIVQTL
ncbi:MAG: glutathione S-transferase family protein [Reyranella sp.]|uniref:glutathione S-transferase family protein n=1 Tax=Reyranella sp. TaxID=1929291 RepID=UPI0027308435|nr:glutathione S-transferase family protein [Reyranella sp.]MDP1961680.1 glutathione S-transferase family protein [Reyranella sp.]MDP2372295.1 glutathione S-transferase family protein [Reyranella sp.]